MALSILLNRARMTVSGTPGTGAITLLAAVAGYQTFAAAGILDQNLVSYVIEDGSNWEYGQGTYTASGTSLARTTILGSSNAGAAISCSSAAIVTLTALAADLKIPYGEPSGRLTNLTGTPVQISSTAGATSVYWTPYNGDVAPFWNGSNWVFDEFVELSQALTDTTKSPAAAAASSVYDIFLWKDTGGVKRISRGPAWTSTIARGTGAGTTQLTLVNGYYCNQFAITNGPAAGYGLYLGTIATNSLATLDYIFGSAASGGGAAFLMVWNNFNRISTQTEVTDNGAPYTYTLTAPQTARNSNGNQVNFVAGQAIEPIYAQYGGNITPVSVAGAFGTLAIRSDTASVAKIGANCTIFTQAAIAYPGEATASAVIPPQLGVHYLQAAEKSDGTNANTFDAASNNALQVVLRN